MVKMIIKKPKRKITPEIIGLKNENIMVKGNKVAFRIPNKQTILVNAQFISNSPFLKIFVFAFHAF